MALYLHDEDVARLLTLDDAVACVDEAFRLLSDGTATNVVRRRTVVGPVTMNVMWSAAPTRGVLGVKEYPVVRNDVTQGTVLMLLLHAFDTGRLLAVVKADRLGQLRTAAASAVATKALARPDASCLAVYGTGYQAETQVLAVAAVLPRLEQVHVVGRSVERRDRFIAHLRTVLDVEIVAAEADQAADHADVIVTATGSAEPVFDGLAVRPGTHLNAVGSNLASKRELDRALLDKADLLVVDDHEVAAEECGDLLANGWDPAATTELGDVLTGRAVGRRSADDITVFESQGLALQDVVCAAHVVERAVERGYGQRLG